MTDATPGELAYETYVAHMEEQAALFPWRFLPQHIQDAWEAAAQAVLEQTAPYESFIRLLSCVHAFMRKRQTGDPSLPWETIDALCLHTLAAVMGDEAYQRWQQSTLALGGTLEEPHDA